MDFLVGLQLAKHEDKRKRKGLLLISLLVNLGFLVYFKYTNFFIETFVDAFKLFGQPLEISTLNIILPVGISFYTFQTLSYTIDIYRGKLAPTKDVLSFFAFVAFFPQLVAGPIERASHLLPQFYKTYTFNYKLVKNGLLLIAFGLFKKMVIADRLAVVVNQVYGNPGEYYGLEVIVATIFFAFQIYCDFSGYSDIAIGVARTMGFDLMKNFDSPYFSKSITEFWRRWHISLSTWFRDYVYIPLGGSRGKNYRTYLNLFIVFVVSGIWHGAAWTFVIWGVIHGVIIIFEKALKRPKQKLLALSGLAKQNFSANLLFTLCTFSIVCFAWIFFRANNISEAFLLISNMGSFDNASSLYHLGLEPVELRLAFIVILLLILFDWFHRKYGALKWINQQNLAFRWASYVLIILGILIFGIYGDLEPKEFIYFQF
ncbi:MBOAT family O-acyltransferase [Flagellimonas myxillae]|uniref:MBOAT family O-acyltransferase n=1 Tax=Flagellimonas myxillae TaxID=2942214 RepID=UPI0029E7D49F|nr:MBOAT family O-acyltransferase [Muricauda myxillae]